MRALNLFKNLSFTIKRQTKKIKLVDYSEKYLSVCCHSQAYRWRLRSIINTMIDFEQKHNITLYTDSFDLQNSHLFVKYLKERSLRNNTIRDIAGKVLALIRKAGEQGYPIEEGLSKTMPRYEITTQVFLDNEELNDIYQLNLLGNKDLIRDVFLLGCYTGLRRSDLLKVTEHNICNNKYILKKTTKTKVDVQIPLHPVALKILQKYNYKIPYPKTPQNFNNQIKDICRLAGITYPVQQEYLLNGKMVQIVKPKYQFVSAHTARRTMITNLYLEKVPLTTIMKISGHKTIEALMLYIRISDRKHSLILSESNYLKSACTTKHISNPKSPFKQILHFRKRRAKSLHKNKSIFRTA